jgi:hypothetical protein
MCSTRESGAEPTARLLARVGTSPDRCGSGIDIWLSIPLRLLARTDMIERSVAPGFGR